MTEIQVGDVISLVDDQDRQAGAGAPVAARPACGWQNGTQTSPEPPRTRGHTGCPTCAGTGVTGRNLHHGQAVTVACWCTHDEGTAA